jgi:hypothetical protein
MRRMHPPADSPVAALPGPRGERPMVCRPLRPAAFACQPCAVSPARSRGEARRGAGLARPAALNPLGQGPEMRPWAQPPSQRRYPGWGARQSGVAAGGTWNIARPCDAGRGHCPGDTRRHRPGEPCTDSRSGRSRPLAMQSTGRWASHRDGPCLFSPFSQQWREDPDLLPGRNSGRLAPRTRGSPLRCRLDHALPPVTAEPVSPLAST